MKKNISKKSAAQSNTISHQDDVTITRFMNAAFEHHNAGRFSEAETLYRTVLGMAPQAIDAYFNLAMILLHERKDSAAALTHLQRALLAAPTNLRIWIAYTEILLISGQAEAAWTSLCDAKKQGVDKTSLVEISAQVTCAITHSHLSQGRWNQATDWAKTGLDIAPNNGKLWHFLGGSLLQSGDLAAAETALQTAITLLPTDAEAWDHMGLVKTALAQHEQAESAFQQSLKYLPTRAITWSNAAVNADNAGQYKQAFEYAAQALRHNPQLNKAYVIQAKYLKEIGELESALSALKYAIDLNLNNPIRFSLESKPMSVIDATQALFDAHACFEAAEIEFFLCAGTLLGIIRDGNLLDFDKDMDIALSADVDRQTVIHTLTHTNKFKLSKTYADEELQWHFSVVHISSNIALDLFFYHTDNDHYLSGFYELPSPILNRPRIFPTEKMLWKGLSWQIPSPPEQYLSDLYGADWATPDPYFNTVISSYCAVQSSIQGRRCHGYFRLCHYIERGQWQHAIHYCLQLNHLYADNFIMDCLAKITQVEATQKSGKRELEL